MDILLRESSFVRLLNHVLNGRILCPRHIEVSNDEGLISLGSSSTSPPATRRMPVKFTGPDDPDMPRNWPTLTKTVVMLDVMLLKFSFYAASAIFTPSILGIEEAFGATTAEGTLGLSLFVIAYGIGPLILSPLSNLPSIGRTPVYVLGSLAFCLFNIGTALAKNLHTILILRFLGGLIRSAPISVGGATLMEIYGPGEIPYAIALYAVSGVGGPILGSFIRERWETWSATLWLISECQAGIESQEANLAVRIMKQTVDDFKLSCIDPVILFVNMHTMLIYGILYLWFEFFPFVFDGIYHFTAIQQGLAKPEVIVEPEARLVPGQLGAICLPVSFFAPGFYPTFQSILNYLGESYPRHVASVFAGNIFFRSSFGGALPLAAPQMLQSLGIGWASSTLEFISIVMVPLPFILERYGKRLHSWSKYAN
ncbi:major facilitator superfamily domain-containing protein [Aspergillus leporis]|uniref:Major facilitator superfamily domain-containing protein n=1 Tax=Aspergillus leporis TaxID=41062 RepID=A0A5N5XCW2_9EURO|nr:major facilitator superfamily domain-containing protein [Aspergillus leporis]